MAYETASASGVNDLLDKLRVFALANGWSVDYWGGRTNVGGGLQAGSNQALAINKGGLYAVLYRATGGSSSDPGDYVGVYTYPGPWVATNGSDAQTNKTTTSFANHLTGPYTAYHFMSSGQYLHAAVEAVPGRFSHFGLGNLEKAGGGGAVPYSYGMRWDFGISFTNNPTSSQHCVPWDSLGAGAFPGGGAFRADSDSIAPRNFEMRDNATSLAIGGWRDSDQGLSRQLVITAPSELTGRATLAPCIVAVERTTGVFSIVGTPRDIRWVRIDNMAPGEIMTIGADQWKVFPIVRKNGPAGIENSGSYGYAYRIVT